ncbi:MAG: LysR substrate-binding domain-containing protein [Acidimicrobiales bacterium]
MTPPARRVASGRPVALSCVRDEPFVCLPPGSGLHMLLLGAASAEGFKPRVQFEADSPAGIRELVAAGLGVALLAESAALAPGATVSLHRLLNAPPHPPIGSIAMRGRAPSSAARVWQRHMAETYADRPSDG